LQVVVAAAVLSVDMLAVVVVLVDI